MTTTFRRDLAYRITGIRGWVPGADEVRSKVAGTGECYSDVTIFYTYDTGVGPANPPTAFTLGHEMPDGWKHSVRRIHAAKIDNYCTGVPVITSA